jgi:hypothetical protein
MIFNIKNIFTTINYQYIYSGCLKGPSISIHSVRHSGALANPPSHFNEYLAGVIDGDGSLLVSKAGYGSLEITMDSRDEVCFHYIKHNVGGGNIKPRSGSRSVRYRLHNKAGMLDMVNRMNGLVRYPQRIVQIKKLCDLYGLEYIEGPAPTKNSAYFAGILDSDGTITCSLKKTKHAKWARPQLTISVSSKNRADLEILVTEFNGSIYADDKGKYVSYK